MLSTSRYRTEMSRSRTLSNGPRRTRTLSNGPRRTRNSRRAAVTRRHSKRRKGGDVYGMVPGDVNTDLPGTPPPLGAGPVGPLKELGGRRRDASTSPFGKKYSPLYANRIADVKEYLAKKPKFLVLVDGKTFFAETCHIGTEPPELTWVENMAKGLTDIARNLSQQVDPNVSSHIHVHAHRDACAVYFFRDNYVTHMNSMRVTVYRQDYVFTPA